MNSLFRHSTCKIRKSTHTRSHTDSSTAEKWSTKNKLPIRTKKLVKESARERKRERSSSGQGIYIVSHLCFIIAMSRSRNAYGNHLVFTQTLLFTIFTPKFWCSTRTSSRSCMVLRCALWVCISRKWVRKLFGEHFLLLTQRCDSDAFRICSFVHDSHAKNSWWNFAAFFGQIFHLYCLYLMNLRKKIRNYVKV